MKSPRDFSFHFLPYESRDVVVAFFFFQVINEFLLGRGLFRGRFFVFVAKDPEAALGLVAALGIKTGGNDRHLDLAFLQIVVLFVKPYFATLIVIFPYQLVNIYEKILKSLL